MDKRSHPIPPNQSNLQPGFGLMSAVAGIAGFSSPAASQGLLGLRAALRHCLIALLTGGSKCRPLTLNGISARFTESHYENNYGAASNRLNAISREIEQLDFSDTTGQSLARLKRPGHVEPPLATGRHMLTGWVRTIEIWLIHHQGRQDLSSLSDHLLKDIGISREDIGTSREDAFWKAGKP